MTGTSLDGIDACLLESWSDGRLRLVDQTRDEFPGGLRERLLAALSPEARLDDILRLERDYTLSLVASLRRLQERSTGPIAAAGIHGQTLRHWPQEGISYQALQPEWLAEHLQLPIVFNFRVADLVAGGQGAPLVPPFHSALLRTSETPADALDPRPQAMLNLGGIANLTVLDASGRLVGFDTGPANVLLDLWADRVLGRPMDIDARLASRGAVHAGLLQRFLQDPYFELNGPRSTGRERFHEGWLCRMLTDEFGPWTASTGSPGQWEADVAATLCALTVSSVVSALRRVHSEGPSRLVVCGGGSRNPLLLRGLTEALPRSRVETSEALGWPADQIEAAAFAWLAAEHLRGHTANDPGVTGASGKRLLGQLVPNPQPD